MTSETKAPKKRGNRRLTRVVAGQEYYTMEGLMKYLGWDMHEVRRWVVEGRLKPSLIVGRMRLFREEYLHEQFKEIEKPSHLSGIEQGTGKVLPRPKRTMPHMPY